MNKRRDPRQQLIARLNAALMYRAAKGARGKPEPGRLDPGAAAPREFLDNLAAIAFGLSRAQVSTEDHFEEWLQITLVTPKQMLVLSEVLRLIAGGADARILFGQNRRRKPSQRETHLDIAAIYWGIRARDPAAPDDPAIAAVFGAISEKLKPSWIRKVAQTYRERALRSLDYPAFVGGSENDLRHRLYGIKKNKRFEDDLASKIPALRAYLKRKGKRRDVEL